MELNKNKRLNDFLSSGSLADNDQIIGGFLARTRPSLGWHVLLGPLAVLKMKQYQIVVSKHKVYFCKLSAFGKLTTIDGFEFDEIESILFKRKMFTYKINIKLKNGKKLTLDANHKVAVKAEGVVLTDTLCTVLQDSVARGALG